MPSERTRLALALIALACGCSEDGSGGALDSGPGTGGAGGLDAALDASEATDGSSHDASDAVVEDSARDASTVVDAAGDAMLPEDAGDASPNVDAGEPRPFQTIAWPSADAVVEIDAMGAFGTDVSGATYEPGTLWLSMNLSPSKLYKLEKVGATWRRVATDGWSNGKPLLFPDGSGIPDAEGVTKTEPDSDSDLVYIGSERNLQGGADLTSRSSVLSYDPSGGAASLTAVQEWNLTEQLPTVGANQGLEAVTWIPDSHLDSFYDDEAYPLHGTGLFVVGLESRSELFLFALGSDGSVALVDTVDTELSGIMGLEYDRSVGYLWAYCDNTCGNRAEILSIVPSGELARRAAVSAPATLPNVNHEGIAVAPDSECHDGLKPFYWVEDGNTNGHVLRAGTIPCGAFLETL